MANYPVTGETIDAYEVKAADGWVYPTDAWSYASASTFTIAGDLTDRIGVGTKLKFTQTTAKYFYVLSASYSAPNTTVTIITNADYTLVNAAMTSVGYSNANSPVGFPQWFNWTPTVTGFSANPTGTAYRFHITGRACTILVYQLTPGTSNATTLTISAPVTNATTVYMIPSAYITDNSAALTAPGLVSINAASATINCYKTLAAGAWTGSGTKSINFQMVVEI